VRHRCADSLIARVLHTGTHRVLTEYSQGTPRVLKKGTPKGTQKRYSNGAQKRYSKAAAKLLRVRAAFLGHSWEVLCTLGVWQYVSGTHGVLKGYSQPRRTHGVLLGCPHSGVLSPAAAVRSGARACGDARVLGGVCNHNTNGLHVETHTPIYSYYERERRASAGSRGARERSARVWRGYRGALRVLRGTGYPQSTQTVLARSWRGTKVHSKGTGGTEGVRKGYSEEHLPVLARTHTVLAGYSGYSSVLMGVL
jgi:hypothetical protein